VVIGLFILWRTAHRRQLVWSNKLLIGTLLLGFSLFNAMEGLIDHQILGVHHVNERVPEPQRRAWDIGFLAWGAAMIVGGGLLVRSGRRETEVAR